MQRWNRHEAEGRLNVADWIFGPPGYTPTAKIRKILPEGNGFSGILCLGEGGGENEERDGLPFRPYAEAGSILERALYRAGIARNTLTLSNMVWWRPPRNFLDGAPWERESIEMCRPWNDELIRARRPRVIVALGGLAMRELTGLAGEKAGIGMTRGFVCKALDYRMPGTNCGGEPCPIPVIGTYHPSFLRRGSKEREESGPKGKTAAAGGGTQGMSLLGVLIRDLLLARDVAKSGAPEFVYHDYKLGGTVGDWERALELLRAHPELPVSYDFETIDSLVAADESEMEIVRRDVTQVQISWQPGQALVSEWVPELRPILQAILELSNPKLDWNGRKFDRPILREMGIRTDLGEWHDLMDFWHYAQPDLPRGLQFATSFVCPEAGPWKHTSVTDPLWYGALDVDMPQRIYAHLNRTLADVRHPISNVSLAEGYRAQVLHVAPVLDRMQARGIPVDEARRLELDAEFSATLERIGGECQPLVPDALKNVTPKNGFVRPPDEVVRICSTCAGRKKLRVAGVKKLQPCGKCGGTGKIELPVEYVPVGFVRRSCYADVPCGCGWARRKLGKAPEAPIADCSRCSNTGKVPAGVERWARIEPFLPGSAQQILRYIEHKREEDIAALYAKAISKNHPEAAKWARERSDWKIPYDHKTGRPTTSEMELRRLRARVNDPLLALVGDYKKIATARGTFVAGWKPGEDGRVHPNFGFKPATPQLSSDNPNCFSEDTEFLTEAGWKHFNEVGSLHWAQYDRETGLIDFAEPLAYISAPFEGELQHIHSEQQIDLLVTADHNCVLQQRRTGAWKTFAASAYPQDWKQFHAGDYVGGAVHYRESQLILMAAFQADGYVVKAPRLKSPRIEFSFSKARKIARLSAALIAEGIIYTEHPKIMPHGKDQVRFRIHVPDWLASWKFFDARILQMDQESFRFFAEEVWKWDGCFAKRTMYASACPTNTDWVQILSILTGRRGKIRVYNGSVSPSYQVDAVDAAYSMTTNSAVEPVPYKGRVNCVTMPKGTVIVRRNGRVAITGQSQNFPSHGDLAKKMKSMIVAPSGKRFFKFDWKSFFIITGGFEARDKEFIRIGRVDMHSFLTLVGLLRLERPEVAFAWPTDELREKLRWWRRDPKLYPAYARKSHPAGMTFGQIRDEIAKRVVFGWENGQGARSLWYLWQETFESTAEAGKCQAALRALFPGVDRWQTEVRERADRDHKLLTRFGHVRYFWDVFQRKPVEANYQPKGDERVMEAHSGGLRWLLKPGDDAEAVVAYLPNADAYGIKRERLVQLAARGWDEKYGLINDVHDALYFECPQDRTESLLADVKPLLEAPCVTLTEPGIAPDGLWVEVETETASDWSNWEKVQTGERHDH